ncbi:MULTISPECIES: Glu/Leu/Phe/Val dehydrogenase dimerization domain-containing protein [unclassified Moorena]|uniref:Glu/Leu/Phe/Val dehydrogenase dimerization domain-containing protein n=1 Tax=unclassified Moorena TaxID=2683338 RepID=UPI0013C9672F|nr:MULTISPECIES: Glu/Leu/Phe/Val dehydrogenase dimerization domain-containing protein [unclassified Moorena]NEO18534.1 Glu/Leu/Phe/Val dehydrogenase [Moorena sp. SIO4A5]NEQ58380.1 Glu/Leu/Phe/Val dehydrogenase [Moorena sp. SIO4A1]
MELFQSIKNHQQVMFFNDSECNLKAIIAIHDTTLGPAMGATRLFPYKSEEDALKDVLRLSYGMTYKAACADLNAGGGKAVIIADPKDKTPELLKAYGRCVNSLKGRFITGQDVNISVEDVNQIRTETQYVVGVSQANPTQATAIGVLEGMKASVDFLWPGRKMEGLKVAVQGVGNVGKILCEYLHQQGVQLFVSDNRKERAEDMKFKYGATIVDPMEIFELEVDIFSPCALGGILNSSTIPRLKASIVAGSANNQLKNQHIDGKNIDSKGILYCPDYVINAGGLIDVYHEKNGYQKDQVINKVKKIYKTLTDIFDRAKREHKTTSEIANIMAFQRILRAKNDQKTIRDNRLIA